jgi:hypothetical protein
LNVLLWVLQGLLALAFLFAGGMKLSQPREKLKEQMAYMEDYSDQTIKLIGGLEVLAAVGLVLPAAIGIATWLTPLAAVGLVLMMIGAVIVHLRRNEGSQVAAPAVLGLLAAVIVWGRFGPYGF